MLRGKRSDGTRERSITESEVKSYVRVRSPGIICWGLCKNILWKITKVLYLLKLLQ